MRIKYDQDLLAVEQNNYLTTIVNLHFVYDFDVWLRSLTISNLEITYLELLT